MEDKNPGKVPAWGFARKLARIAPLSHSFTDFDPEFENSAERRPVNLAGGAGGVSLVWLCIGGFGRLLDMLEEEVSADVDLKFFAYEDRVRRCR